MKYHPGLDTFGDVRRVVNAFLVPTGLHTAGGEVYPLTHKFRFSVETDEASRQGEAFCLLPKGWLRQVYSPSEIGEPTGPKDCLRFNVATGVGRMTVHNVWISVSEFTITPGFESKMGAGPDGVEYLIENTSDSELLIVRAQSTAYPTNRMDINPSPTDNETFRDDYPLSKFGDF